MIYWKIIFQMVSKPPTTFPVLVRINPDWVTKKLRRDLKGSPERWPIDILKMNRLILLSEYNNVIW